MVRDVFISYSTIDRPVALQVLDTLEKHGLRCWIAPRDVSPGVEWMEAITEAISESRVMVLIFSGSSNQSDDVKREVRFALDKKKTVIPFRCEEVRPSGAMEYLLTGVHWQDAFSYPLEPHLNALATRISAIVGPKSRRIDGSDLTEHYFDIQRQLIDQYTSQFVGREGVERELDQFLKRHRRGYFLVRGGPGQGKTAVACHLVKDRGYVHHFVNRSGGRSDPRLILLSLLAQLRVGRESDDPVPDRIPELAKMFEDTVTQCAEEDRLVIVIDGLDEFPAGTGDELPCFITSGLSDGASFVVTSRPGPALDTLVDTLHGLSPPIPVCEYDLGPLEFAGTSEILRAKRPDLTAEDIERIAEASHGNPLYLHAMADELARDSQFDLCNMPASIVGFFRRATANLRNSEHPEVVDVLGSLAVARKQLSLQQLSQITGHRQRSIDEHVIRPIEQFLIEANNEFGFYHEQFHDFVTKELLYQDELAQSHLRLAKWLQSAQEPAPDYRLTSLAYHLYEAGQTVQLSHVVDQPFLAEKLAKFGYSVLEDIELLTRSMLDVGDPSLVPRCVELVDGLREVVGEEIIDDAAQLVRAFCSGPESFRTNVIAPKLPKIEGLDIYAGMLPKTDACADFFELAPLPGRPVLTIGDVPGTGLKSAFVARFLANSFRKLAEQSSTTDVGRALTELNRIISVHPYFAMISMLCVGIDLPQHIVSLANAGHPLPVYFSARRGLTDRLPVRGNLLNEPTDASEQPIAYETRRFEIQPGDILVLVTDGLTEGHQLQGEPYGYRFRELVEELHSQNARKIGEAILDDWRSFPRPGDYADDVTVVVICVRT